MCQDFQGAMRHVTVTDLGHLVGELTLQRPVPPFDCQLKVLLPFAVAC